MILERFEKQPSEIKDYDINYTEWLSPMADTIASVSASVTCLTDADDTDLVIDAIQNTPQVVKLWLSGGTDRAKYKVTVQATTAGGRKDESELIFTVRDY